MTRRGFAKPVTIFAAAALAAAGLATGSGTFAQEQPEPASFADTPASDNEWKIYRNPRFGMELSYPTAFFTPSDPLPNGDGQQFAGSDALLETFGWPNSTRETPDSLQSELLRSEGYQNVDLNEVSESSLTLSGTRGQNVFYEKYLFRGGTIQAFGIEYPVSRRATYDAVVEEIAASFVAGDPAEAVESTRAADNAIEPETEPSEPGNADASETPDRVLRFVGRPVDVPRGHLPPPGECRTWYSDRPAGHQPPPHKC